MQNWLCLSSFTFSRLFNLNLLAMTLHKTEDSLLSIIRDIPWHISRPSLEQNLKLLVKVGSQFPSTAYFFLEPPNLRKTLTDSVSTNRPHSPAAVDIHDAIIQGFLLASFIVNPNCIVLHQVKYLCFPPEFARVFVLVYQTDKREILEERDKNTNTSILEAFVSI